MQAESRRVATIESITAAIASKIDSAAFASWIAPCRFEIADNTLTVIAPNQFSADFIKSVYSNAIESVASEYDLKSVVSCSNKIKSAAPSNDNELKTFTPKPATVNPEPSFDNFVCSDENAFVLAACKKMAVGGAAFSPLYIYGAAGCGKSLLAECVGFASGGRVLAMTGGQFVSEFLRAMREHSVFAFKDFCRNCDTFILDDVHVLSGKNATLDEFMHLILDLRARGANIMLTANVAPGNLSGFDRRLQSLMASGLVADLALPDAAVRRAMLRRAGVNADVADAVAARVGGDGHLVGGVAKKIRAYADLMGENVTLAIAERLLSDLIEKTKTPGAMVRAMCDALGVAYDAVCGTSRMRTVVRARQIMMAALKHSTKLTLSDIGLHVGGRDHATVLYAVGQIEKLKSSDLILGAQIDQMIELCR